jgi:hypothetical protein
MAIWLVQYVGNDNRRQTIYNNMKNVQYERRWYMANDMAQSTCTITNGNGYLKLLSLLEHLITLLANLHILKFYKWKNIYLFYFLIM